ncbi:copper homeostasis protein [Chitinophaga terrae (ex Kim and Jung 2007)]|uniref:PF03932 family protein CutC n=1 Tax=Chitinophaga terrae (ex Kim and Jung 2007) TaxID=408074 RepID=A0A1H4E334_9BACT|nr:copper homeostasis protein CutC [Chitinophaga terrae (ex Kim and Jung 2007)]MDQ0108264.1 copper homeostasis protein [Chitinophaga terrae (ex Kim and Jung 2007)]GEP91432.1 copper homeostasis protein CutC [Chitinophaga terrae (ex Kim and Jung 2007)]SEA79443.1 copper homeostasis protein [Chitinophaga terrae (ex Kim and Jung 2007)]
MAFILEICAGSVASCIAAQKGGADRIELCDNLLEGGTTPSYGTIALAREKTSIKLYPIIRPRGGDFLYSDLEFDTMIKDIQLCKQLGCDGVVIGILTPDGKVDKERCKVLVTLAAPMKVTFHRAFDMTDNPFEALEDIISLGFERILTSGGRNTALEGASTLRQLVNSANDRIAVMAGSGVRSSNIAQLIKETGITEYHTSAKSYEDSKMVYRHPNVSMGGIPGVPEYGISQTREKEVALIREIGEKTLLS